MRPIVQTLSDASGGAKSVVMPLDYMARPQVSLQVDVTGTANFTVQQTLDNVFDSSITPTWFNHPDTNLVSATADAQSNYAYTPFAVKLLLNSGSGSAKITILQTGTMV